MAEIVTTNGFTVLVDDEDLPLVEGSRWYARLDGNRRRYATRRWRPDRRVTKMHRLILGDDAPPQVDHENGNGLDNRRRNLREATNSQNQQNARASTSPRKRSRFKGLRKVRDRWSATIKKDGRDYYLGTYGDEETAARVYDDAARRLFGSFACTNFGDRAD